MARAPKTYERDGQWFTRVWVDADLVCHGAHDEVLRSLIQSGRMVPKEYREATECNITVDQDYAESSPYVGIELSYLRPATEHEVFVAKTAMRTALEHRKTYALEMATQYEAILKALEP